MTEFTYRTARSGSQVVGLVIAIAVEAVITEVFLRAAHPLITSAVTALSIAAIAWLAADYRSLGRGAVRLNDQTLDLRVGRRVAGHVPLRVVAHANLATWRDLPAIGSRDSGDYRNLMKPAPPNVLLILTEPSSLRWFGVTIHPRRLGLRLDDPSRFIEAMQAKQPSLQGATL